MCNFRVEHCDESEEEWFEKYKSLIVDDARRVCRRFESPLESAISSASTSATELKTQLTRLCSERHRVGMHRSAKVMVALTLFDSLVRIAFKNQRCLSFDVAQMKLVYPPGAQPTESSQQALKGRIFADVAHMANDLVIQDVIQFKKRDKQIHFKTADSSVLLLNLLLSYIQEKQLSRRQQAKRASDVVKRNSIPSQDLRRKTTRSPTPTVSESGSV